ncbi:NmrA domain-containing protein [Fusarium keratoplasticum]|uniref:NmrA domain-containing protein n=1 Tax=Fusarium keratoplasticum TaxID=1328300 RepID=A0ACC0QDP2_9HYPO|nr:NmrA domain-containing protein [Fusarium keratoplasticum]KAI8649261.1 NmrA domain-containing protein [Fusarium keratoplasticum]
MARIITVFGATGNQGGSVIDHILADNALSKDFRIRGITRDPAKPASQKLAERGVELATADMNSKDSLVKALSGSHTVFLVTNYWESMNADTEITQGKNVADAAKEVGVSHIIFSSLLNVTEVTGGRLTHVPHFDGKAKIEQYIRSTGVPSTFVLPGYFMSNYIQMLRREEDGSYTLAYPVGDKAKFPLFDAASDTGKFVKPALKDPQSFKGKHILAATDYYTPERVLSEFEEVTGKKTKYVQVSAEQYKSFLPAAMAEEMLENHLFVEEPGYYNGASLEESLSVLEDKPTTWKEFITKSGAF